VTLFTATRRDSSRRAFHRIYPIVDFGTNMWESRKRGSWKVVLQFVSTAQDILRNARRINVSTRGDKKSLDSEGQNLAFVLNQSLGTPFPGLRKFCGHCVRIECRRMACTSFSEPWHGSLTRLARTTCLPHETPPAAISFRHCPLPLHYLSYPIVLPACFGASKLLNLHGLKQAARPLTAFASQRGQAPGRSTGPQLP